MTCSKCGGCVEWKGPISNLTHTECAKCGGINCQEPEVQTDDDESVDGPTAGQCDDILGRAHYNA